MLCGDIMFTAQQIKRLISDNRLDRFYNDYYWRRLAHTVLTEQHNECQQCKARGKYTRATIVHHANYLRKRPDLAYSRTYIDSNGREQKQLIALCHDCHEQIHQRGAYKAQSAKKFTNEEKW